MSQPSLKPLDLYARVEDLLGVKEAAPDLYAHYLLSLQERDFSSLLDVGCGNGDFIRQMQGAFPHAQFHGIDLSVEMVRRARKQGVEAEAIDLCEVSGRYDVITAVFDVLNYLEPPQLKRFGDCLRDRLNPGGVFLCDITSLYGFDVIASGAFQAEDENRFVAIDADFDGEHYTSKFVLFEREGEQWLRSDAAIDQRYYAVDALADLLGMNIAVSEPVSLYGEEADKIFMVMRPSL